MSKESIRNRAASVKSRLLNLARERREDPNLLMKRYATERLLYRLSQSPHRERFILKGATLFWAWMGDIHRPTKDIDLLSYGSNDVEVMRGTFVEIATIKFDDGLVFKDIRSDRIKADQQYEGVRVRLDGLMGSAKLSVQVDIGFGDAIAPSVQQATLPPLLSDPPPVLLAYPPETVVAEKLQAIVELGERNTRIKDFYDLAMLSRTFSFQGGELQEAIAATFARRQTAVPERVPFGLTEEFAAKPGRQSQWEALLQRGALVADPSLARIGKELQDFLMPACVAIARREKLTSSWSGEAGWHHP